MLWVPCCRGLYFFKYALSEITFRILNLHLIEGQKCLFFIYLVLNAVFIPICHDKAVQDVISPKTVLLWLRDAVYNSWTITYRVMQSDRNSLKTDTFHEPTTYERQVQTENEQKTTFARHEYGRVGVFRIKIRSLFLKLQPLEKCQFSNCSHLIASHCTFNSKTNEKMKTLKYGLVDAQKTLILAVS